MYDAIFDEDVELDNYIIAGAPYGGALGKVFRYIGPGVGMAGVCANGEE